MRGRRKRMPLCNGTDIPTTLIRTNAPSSRRSHLNAISGCGQSASTSMTLNHAYTNLPRNTMDAELCQRISSCFWSPTKTIRKLRASDRTDYKIRQSFARVAAAIPPEPGKPLPIREWQQRYERYLDLIGRKEMLRGALEIYFGKHKDKTFGPWFLRSFISTSVETRLGNGARCCEQYF
jgi:hypothetical protein